jgi:hypothetical protein
MREWFLKPLLIVLAILVVLAAVSLVWLQTGPSPAGASEKPLRTPHQVRLEEAIREVEKY